MRLEQLRQLFYDGGTMRVGGTSSVLRRAARDLWRFGTKLTGTMTVIDQMNEKVNDCIEAQEAGNYAVALIKAESAWMLISFVPDSELENERLEWARETLPQLMAYLKKRVNETADDGNGGRGAIIRPVDVHYQRG